MKKVCFFTVLSDTGKNKEYAQMMISSLKKFHPDVPHIIRPFEEIHNYRIYALHGKELAKEYETVISIDGDCIVTGSLDHIINGDYEVGSVLNNNLIDPALKMWDTPHQFYVNCGLVAIKGTRPWEWWHSLNQSVHWQSYRFREQDMLNIMFHYGDLKSKIFDHSNTWNGLISKGRWDKIVLKDNKLIMPKEVVKEYIDAGYNFSEEDKEIRLIHWAGGQVPKMNYFVHFKKEVAEYIDSLVKEAK